MPLDSINDGPAKYFQIQKFDGFVKFVAAQLLIFFVQTFHSHLYFSKYTAIWILSKTAISSGLCWRHSLEMQVTIRNNGILWKCSWSFGPTQSWSRNSFSDTLERVLCACHHCDTCFADDSNFWQLYWKYRRRISNLRLCISWKVFEIGFYWENSASNLINIYHLSKPWRFPQQILPGY